jgi:hypothetical protein
MVGMYQVSIQTAFSLKYQGYQRLGTILFDETWQRLGTKFNPFFY